MEKKLVITFCILSLFMLHCNCSPAREASSSDGENSEKNGLTTIQTVLLSVGLLTGVVVCSFCTWSWWVRLCRALRGIEEPIVPPAAEFNGYGRDPVHFDPIVTITGSGSGEELRETNVPYIVPLADEVNAYAHDWFETELGNNNFNRSNIEYIAEMGKGWFGNVIKSQLRHANPFHERIPAVVKVLREEATNREQMRFLDEARFYRDENHENILKLLGYSIERSPYLLIFEYWPLGTLKEYLVTKCSDTQNHSMLVRMAIDVAKGLEWMEHAGFVHGDLAARNCLVANSAGKVIIGDYGLSTQRFREEYYWSSNTAIPIRWTAPECLHTTMNTIITNKATTFSNVWTFGVVLWEIAELGKLPYPDLSDEEVLDQVITGRTYILLRPASGILPEAINDKLYNIMLTCFNTDPSTRPRITEILNVLKKP